MVSTVMPMAVTAEKSSDPRIQFGEAYYANDSKTVKITVSIENNPGFVSTTIPVTWNKDQLTLKGVAETDLIDNGLLESGSEPQGIKNCGWIGYTITEEVGKSGQYHLAWNYDTMYAGDMTDPQELEFTKSGKLCVMEFEVKKNLSEGEEFVISADLDDTLDGVNNTVNVMNWDMKDLTKEAEPAGVTIMFGAGRVLLASPEEEPTQFLGDINSDSELNSSDAVYLLNHIMFGDRRFPINYTGNIDFTGDGSNTTSDAVYLLNHIMFGDRRFPIQ